MANLCAREKSGIVDFLGVWGARGSEHAGGTWVTKGDHAGRCRYRLRLHQLRGYSRVKAPGCYPARGAVPVYGFAVCRYDSGELYRFSCNRDWETVNDSDHDDEETAKRSIPVNYLSSVHRVVWQKAGT
jgi:hypothetical protein